MELYCVIRPLLSWKVIYSPRASQHLLSLLNRAEDEVEVELAATDGTAKPGLLPENLHTGRGWYAGNVAALAFTALSTATAHEYYPNGNLENTVRRQELLAFATQCI